MYHNGYALGGPPLPVIVTIRDSVIILGSPYIPIIPLLQGGGPPKLYMVINRVSPV